MAHNYSEKIEKMHLFLIEAFIGITIFFMPISKALVEIGSISAIVLWLIFKAVKKEGFSVPRTILFPYLLFLVLCLASLIPADLSDWKNGSRGLLKWLQYFGFFCLCAEWFTTEARVYRALTVFLSSMTLVTVNGFYQLATGTDFLRHVSLDPGRITRMKSSLGAPNTLAAFYLFAIPVTAACLGVLKRWRIPLVLIILLFGSGFILTFSRAAFLALMASTLFLLALQKKWKWLLGLLCVLAAALILVRPFYENFFGSLNFKDISVGERLRYWSYTWDMIQSHPWIGVGINLFMKKLPLFIPAGEIYSGYAHNSYLQIWAEVGLLGLLSFLFPLTHLAVSLHTKKLGESWLNTCLSVGCLAFLLQAIFDNHFFSMQPAFLFFCFWGMWVGLANIKSKGVSINFSK